MEFDHKHVLMLAIIFACLTLQGTLCQSTEVTLASDTGQASNTPTSRHRGMGDTTELTKADDGVTEGSGETNRPNNTETTGNNVGTVGREEGMMRGTGPITMARTSDTTDQQPDTTQNVGQERTTAKIPAKENTEENKVIPVKRKPPHALSMGTIIGIAFGSAVVLALILFCICGIIRCLANNKVQGY